MLPFALVTAGAWGALGACKQAHERSEAVGLAERDGGSVPPATAPALAVPSAMALLNPEKLPAYAGPVGSVEGTVFVTGEAPPDVPAESLGKCPGAPRTRAKMFRTGSPSANGSPLAYALVVITGYSGFYVPERHEAHRLTLADCAEAPRTIAMTFGQRLEIINASPVVFAPELASAPLPAVMIAAPHGGSVALTPPEPGHYKLVDRLGGGFLAADVYAFLHPLHTVTDVDGRYRIDGVPAGTWQIHSRLAVVGEATQPVEVRAGAVQKVDFTLKYIAPSHRPPLQTTRAVTP